MNLKIKIVLSLMCFSSMSYAQYFVEENLSFSKSKGAYVITNDGERIDGEFAWLKFNRYSIKELALEIDGKKQSFKAEDIKVFVGVPTNFSKFGSAMDRSTDLTKMTDTDFETVIKRDSSYYEQAMVPRKQEYRMVQLLNPGFDSKIKVFKDPFAKETTSFGVAGMKVAGGDDKSYLVKKEGMDDTMFVTKKNFKESFVLLFGDNEEFIKFYGDKPNSVKIQNFADHVFLYHEMSK